MWVLSQYICRRMIKKKHWEKVYFKSQILGRPSIGEYWHIIGVPLLPENVTFTFFRMCWCYSEAYNPETQKWSSIVKILVYQYLGLEVYFFQTLFTNINSIQKSILTWIFSTDNLHNVSVYFKQFLKEVFDNTWRLHWHRFSASEMCESVLHTLFILYMLSVDFNKEYGILLTRSGRNFQHDKQTFSTHFYS